MKVILLNNLDKVGKKGEVVSVKRGFARNYLIPRELALYATPDNMKQLSSIQANAAEEEAKVLAELKKLDGKIRGISLAFARKVDENEHMFGSVSENDISLALADQGVNVHKSMVIMDKHIKTLGETLVQIRLHKDIVSELKIVVEKENKDVPVVEEPVKAAVVEPVIEEEEILIPEPVIEEAAIVAEETPEIEETPEVEETEEVEEIQDIEEETKTDDEI